MADSTAQTNPQAQASGLTSSFYATGMHAPATGLSWDILKSGVSQATSSSHGTPPNDWEVSVQVVNSQVLFQVQVPPTAASGNDYEVRYTDSTNGNRSALFGVTATAPAPEGPAAPALT